MGQSKTDPINFPRSVKPRLQFKDASTATSIISAVAVCAVAVFLQII